ncbi:hypothetical protein UFOVP464_7 [uncultured Caudovirales phage]|uniref:Uncharacterized protein n=1 Tax=uncultured Caudovirales phage TaxID=2100421 RepID=A0A6J5RCA9_9CAUD|nr:hypothetical protein UFOVP464_7 [uncultured Caudovirales phage]CAB4189234.1 hypothetical protein UFOVP1189_22 [uncultured Caudovirales phage]
MATIEERVVALVATPFQPDGRTTKDRLAYLVAALQAARITPDVFEVAFRAELAASSLRAYAQGAASVRLTPGDVGAVERLVQANEPNIAAFTADIAAGREPIPTTQRVSMYADSAHQALQTGQLAAAAVAGQRVRWVLGEDDDANCEPCQTAADGGPYLPGALPGLPGWPFCTGGANCRCEIVPA